MQYLFIQLSESEMPLLNKGLDFCPSTKEPNKEQLLGELYFSCRKLKLKEYFRGGDSNTDKIQQEERCDLNTKLPNCYFNPNHKTPLNLQRYVSILKKEVTELLKKPNYQQSNLTSEERLKFRRLSGGKIVIMDTADYIEHCELLLTDREFYEKLDANPTLIYTEKIKQKIDDMLKNNYIIKQEYNYLAENLENPRTPLFYGLLKMHKIFDSFPPLRPIVSSFNLYTCNLSKFVDSFLKCKSYIRDTTDFLIKLSLKIFQKTVFLLLWSFHLFTLTLIMRKVQRPVLKS